MTDIYPYEKRLQSLELKIASSTEILPSSKELIQRFKNDCFAHNIGLARVIRYLFCLRDMAQWLTIDFQQASIDEIKALVAKIERMEKYAPRTKCEYRATLKKFYKWLKGNDNPLETSWIKLNLKKHNDKLPSDLPTESDILKMVNNTPSLRDRAIIVTLYESGCRVGEFIKLTLKDVTFDKYGACLDVTGKTGGRRVRIVTASKYLMDWINEHPDKDNPKAFLWTKNNCISMLEYPALTKVLRVGAKRANVKKKVNPHNFRHARATYLASKLTEQQLKLHFGWTRSSEMAAVYVHLNGRDVESALLGTYGIKVSDEDSSVSKLTPINCVRCSSENKPTDGFCSRCGLPLNKEEANRLIRAEL